MRQGKRTPSLSSQFMQKERQAKPGVYAIKAVSSSWMKTLAKRIARDLKNGQWKHCAVYEDELKRVWPLDQKDREAKIAQFAKEYGFRLRDYKK
jgi:hypothetical protein